MAELAFVDVLGDAVMPEKCALEASSFPITNLSLEFCFHHAGSFPILAGSPDNIGSRARATSLY